MKVLFITNLFPLENAVCNGEYVRQQALWLSKFCDVDVTYPKPLFPQLYTWLEKRKQKTFFVPKSPIGLEDHNIRFFYFRYPYFTKWGLKDRLKFIGLLLYVLAKGRPDLIHAHFTYECGYLGVLLGRLLKIPVIITVHESFVFLVGKDDKGEDGKWDWDEPLDVIKKKYLFALKNSAQVIAVSGKVSDALVKLGVNPGKIAVIGNGVDHKKFKIKSGLSGLESKKIILYVGGIFPGKGVFDLLDAVRSLSLRRDDFLLVLIGSAGNFLKKLNAHIAKNKLEDVVRFIGPKLHDDLPSYFCSASVCALPSYQETFSCTTIEALACGTPLVGTPVGVIADIIVDGKNGFIVPIGDSDTLAEKLSDALDRKWNKESIRNSVIPFYWPNVAASLREIYEKTSLH